MTKVELKKYLHDIINDTDNEILLSTLVDFFEAKKTLKPGQMWDSLTEGQKAEVLLSFNDSNDDDNLIDLDTLFSS